jgi:hypothetical protein
VHRPADSDALPLAARQLRDGGIDRDADAPETDRLQEDLRGDRLFALDVDETEAVGDLPADEEVAPERLLVGKRTVLVDGFNRQIMRHAHGIIGGVELPVADEDAAGGGRHDAGHHLDQRRLAGAVIADQADDLVAADRQRNVAQRPDRAEGLADILQPNDVLEGGLDGGGFTRGLLHSTPHATVSASPEAS